MFEFSDPKTFWLIIINILLGVTTLACCVVVGRKAYLDIKIRHADRFRVTPDEHTFSTPGVGVTMADGGRRIGYLFDGTSNDVYALEDENIFRSEN